MTSREELLEEAKKTGWLTLYGGSGPFDIETVCAWCGCIVRVEFQNVHRLRCTQPPEEPT